jgi:beta propeller repeat protein
MKNNIKLHLVALTALVILFLIIVPSAASADPLTITETRISTSGAASNPDIYDGKIVWQDAPNGGNIYVYDISTKKETKIHTDGYGNYNPAIHDNKIVYEWVSYTEPDYGIGVYDLSTNKDIWGDWLDMLHYDIYPAIYGSRIIWFDDAGIWMHNLSTNTETQISSKEFASNPAIYEDKIVWTDGNISMYDLSTNKETKITTSVSASSPRIYGSRIVYINVIPNPDEPWNSFSDIYMYDLSTQKETLITKNGSAPAIYEDKIVWTNGNIYMYDLSTNTKTQITKSGSASNPRIYEDRIVWQDSRNGKSDIYMGTLSSSNPLAAYFSASPLSGKAPLKVQFIDKSTGSPTSWAWNFGDKTTSTAKNPAHTYSKAGKYTVTLTVKSAAGSNTATKSSYITVLSSPVGAFSASPTSGKAPLTVKFTDKNTGIPSSWYWNFGDGSTSNVQNPIHKYAKVGKYTVTLKVTNAAGSNTVIKRSYITVLNPPVAAFSASPTSGKAPLTVKFIDKSTGSPSSWYWNFGDGSTSKVQNPVHKYTKAGRHTYTVTLKVTNMAGSNTAKRTITTS